MNSTFKVVFNKARGALMVVNEVTSSVQAKGTKTVIAAAVATMIAGTASAASAFVEAPLKDGALTEAAKDTTVLVDATKAEFKLIEAAKLDEVKDQIVFVTDKRGTATGADANGSVLITLGEKDKTVDLNKTIWMQGVKGESQTAQAHIVWANKADQEITNSGTIYITTDADTKSWSNSAMGVDKGTIVNAGTIVAKKAYGMSVGSSGGEDVAKVVNNGTIIVEDEGVAIELGGQSNDGTKATKAEGTNAGTITVTAAKNTFGIGVQIKGADGHKLVGQKFTNTATGVITATGDKDANLAAAIYVQNAEGAKVINEGTIEGDVIVDANTVDTAITNAGSITGDITVAEGATGTTITLYKDSSTTGDVVNEGAQTTIEGTTVEGAVSVIEGDVLAKGGTTVLNGALKFNDLKVSSANESCQDVKIKQAGVVETATVTLANGSITVNGALKTGAVIAETDSDKNNLVVNGKVEAESLSVVGVVKTPENEAAVAQNAATQIAGSGELSVGAITVQGVKTKINGTDYEATGVLTVAMTVPTGADENFYNLTAESLTVGNKGTATLTTGDLAIGTVSVLEGGVVSGAASIEADSIEIAKGAKFANEAYVEAGTLTNAAVSDVSFAALAVTNGTNNGSMDVGFLKVEDGSFTNNAVVSTEEATKGQITNKLQANYIYLDNADFVNTGVVEIQDSGSLTLTNGATYKSALVLVGADGKTLRGEDAATLSTTKLGENAQVAVYDGAAFVIDGLNSWVVKDKDGNVLAKETAELKKTAAFDKLTLNGNWKLNDGYLKVGEETLAGKVVDLNGTLKVYNRDDFKVGTITVNDGARLKLGLESSDPYSADEFTSAEIETLKVVSGGAVDLDGDLAVTTKFENAVGSTVTVGADGELTVDAAVLGMTVKNGDFDFAKNKDAAVSFFNAIASNAGVITVNGLEGEVDYAKIVSGAGVVSDNTGLLYLNGLTVDVDDLLDDDGKISVSGANSLNGVVTSATRELTVLADGNAADLAGEFGKVEFKGEGTTTLTATANKILKLNADGNIVTSKDGKAGNVAIANDATFIYAGKAEGEGGVVGNVEGVSGSFGVESGKLTAQAVDVADLAVAGALNVEKTLEAENAAVAGALNVKDDVTVDYLNVAGDMTVAASKVVADDPAAAVKLEVDYAEVTGKLEALGEVTVDDGMDITEGGIANLGTVTASGTINVGDNEGAGKLSVNTLKSGVVFADPAYVDGVAQEGSEVYVQTIDEAGRVQAGRASMVAIGVDGTNAEAVAKVAADVKEAGFTQYVEGEVESVLYINGSAEVKGGVLANAAYYDEAGDPQGDMLRMDPDDKGIETDYNTLTVIDVASFGDQPIVAEDLDVALLGDVYLVGAEHGQAITFVSGEGEFHADNVRTAYDRILGVKITNGTDGGLAVAVKEGDELGALANAVTIGTVQDYFKGNKSGNKFVEGMMSSNNGMTDAQVVTALNDVAGIGASAGMASVTMDALSAFNDTVAQRTSILAPNAEGTTVWADVNGGRYEAKKLFNGAGYSSDIYAGVLGVDTVVACGAKIGAALTVGTGDTDSKNTTAVTSMDSDFFGISVYTAKTFGDVANVAIDLGYMQGSNDVSVKAYDLGKFSADSDAFTLGIRGELLTKAGSFNVVPHAGLRWTRISVDSFEAGYTTDIDNMNVFQLPVGVTVSGEFEGAGFTWAPAFDLSFVPAFGDKDADMTLGIAGSKAAATSYGVQVIDSNPVQATLGIDATNGAWAFGLNYKLGVGTDSRMNNSFNANVRYTF